MLRTLLAIVSMFAMSACSTIPMEQSRTELKKERLESYIGRRAVKLIAQRGGSGSGVILRSTRRGSIIMTNMHVCKPLQMDKGFIIHNNRRVAITHYKISKMHDICVVRVAQNLGVKTKIAKRSPRKFETLYSAGHPNGQPLTIVNGTMSNRITIRIMYGYIPCEPTDRSMDCMFYGSKQDVRDMDSQYVSSLGAPGSSGSGVFNHRGELVGLIFAGLGRSISYNYNVPYEYLIDFIEDEQKELKWQRHVSGALMKSQGTRFLPMPQVLGIVK